MRADAIRIIDSWRAGSHPVDVFVSVTGIGATHRILGWLVEVDGAPGVLTKDRCFVLLPKHLFDEPSNIVTTTNARGTRVEITADGCEIHIADYSENEIIRDAS